MQKTLQIVVFDNPSPPNYGGVIDVYYKLKALNGLGVNIILHVFYAERTQFDKLENLSHQIYTYKRNTSYLNLFSTEPFSTKSRSSKQLWENLNLSKAPILFESLICTSVLKHHNFSQQILLRTHNIEHDYSFGLAKSERNWLKKAAFYLESLKLKHYESVLKKTDVILSLSVFETQYFKTNYKCKVAYLKVFQEHSEVISESGNGNYALYHGDLSIADNVKSALFLIKVFSGLQHKLVMASSFIPKILKRMIENHSNITLKEIKHKEELEGLIQYAHINTLYSFQKSGTKLKVFTALFKGKHCIINKNMIDDEAILDCCEVAESISAYKTKVNQLFQTNFEISQQRKKALKSYNPDVLAQQLIELVN
jgi:hypothetical protein